VGKPFGREEFDQLLGHCQVRDLHAGILHSPADVNDSVVW
jgi:hypothetical protein